ncbi:MAG: ferritin-like domain-containing protein [Bacteroidota bacterium]
MLTLFRSRYYDVLASVYIYNEYQAYTSLERLLAAIKEKYPNDSTFIHAVSKHTQDERKHYRMFKSYFEHENRMPLAVDSMYGYIDQFVKWIFGRTLEELNERQILESDDLFFKLCRVIMMTEFRGMKQVDVLLRSGIVQRHPSLLRIFKVIEHDEPSHCFPYKRWLEERGAHLPGFEERFTDLWVHYSLMLVTMPILFLNVQSRRLAVFYDQKEESKFLVLP